MALAKELRARAHELALGDVELVLQALYAILDRELLGILSGIGESVDARELLVLTQEFFLCDDDGCEVTLDLGTQAHGTSLSIADEVQARLRLDKGKVNLTL